MTESCISICSRGDALLRIPAALLRSCCVALIALLVLALPARADEQETEYLRIYQNIQQADSLDASGKTEAALAKYQQAHADLVKFRKAYPSWNKDMVSFRMNYVAEKAAACSEKLNAAAEPKTTDASKTNAPGPGQSVTAQTAPTAGEPIVKLMQPGAEPRKVLRLQPKPGDKQTLGLTMKMGMEVGMGAGQAQQMKLPPVLLTMENTVKNVSPDGDITYESRITDASVADEPGAMPQTVEAMKSSVGNIKGLAGSGIISSRGFKKDTQMKMPESASPQARQAMEQMWEVLSMIAAPLPEEPVGPGAKWEVKMTVKSEGINIIQKATYEVTSIEGDRVAAKTTATQAAANQKIENPAMPGMKMDLTKMTGQGSGEVTIDLTRLIPPEGSFAYNSDAAMSIDAGGQKQTMTMKMQMNLRVQTK